MTINRNSLLDKIFEPDGLRIAGQPVYQLAGREPQLHYVEALIRGPFGTNLEEPLVLFEYARQKDAETQLDQACLSTLLRATGSFSSQCLISVNVQTTTISRDPGFAAWLSATAMMSGIAMDRLVLEITDDSALWDQRHMTSSINLLRETGARIALDNFGSQNSGWQLFLNSEVDYLKIDRSIIHGVATDYRRQAVLDSLAFLSRRAGTRLIACGIETAADLKVVREAGIELVQGFLFSHPLPLGEMAATCAARHSEDSEVFLSY